MNRSKTKNPAETGTKEQVRQFYDRVGWQLEGNYYQNARYEDLRPVSREYIRRCHLRVNRYLKPSGRYLLDAGSGPVQYPEYLSYSEQYLYRVCLDISFVALIEARKRLGERGLYVLADVANLPFHPDVFDGIVSLHTLHHMALEDQQRAYADLYRVLAADSTAVIVNGWTDSVLMHRSKWLMQLVEGLGRSIARLRGKPLHADIRAPNGDRKEITPTGTFVQKLDAVWLRREIGSKMNLQILVWRSVSVRWLRAFIHAPLGGHIFLRILYWLEERSPEYYGEKGQYPLIVISKRS